MFLEVFSTLSSAYPGLLNRTESADLGAIKVIYFITFTLYAQQKSSTLLGLPFF